MDIRQKAPTGAGTRSVTLTMTLGPRCDIDAPGGHVIVTDEARERGGGNAGASPLAHLTAALASCQAVQVHK
ncbi:MAG: OsmC family protein, partial [Alphaproteobacteria bacterium]